jgi:NADH-quinone oxidoreductase subunit F
MMNVSEIEKLSLTRPLTARFKSDGEVVSLAEYQSAGGYLGFKKALSMAPSEVLETVKKADLKGRGGAGFSTGLKWSFVPQGEQCPTPKYLIANADEMEPGTFKDRWLMENDPHQLLEGMMIAAYAIGASTAYVFLRADYNLAAKRIQSALDEAYENQLLGESILTSDFQLDIHLHTSAGRYICGEETALINALEGKRANPRSKPPFPQVSGFFGKPTVVNNVETLCNVPHILRLGVDWYQGLGLNEDTGTKIFGVSGRVNNPGAWELPMGTKVREIIDKYAGGMQPGYSLRGFLPGGGSTDFLTTEHLDLEMGYSSIGKAVSRMGTGTMILLDDKTCPVSMVLNLIEFFAQESCGWCTPCRNGLPFMREILRNIESGKGHLEDIDRLAEFCEYVGPGNTFCALAPGAAEPVQSALKYFRDDFVEHIKKGGCTYAPPKWD